MSITVRTWTDEELENISTEKDYWLATIFMNMTTFTAKEHKHYPYNLRKKYLVDFDINGTFNQEKVFATDDKNLIKFVKAEYDWKLVTCIMERVVTRAYRNVDIEEEEQ